ncbi:MAG: SoxR reducing system RseC family protein [Parabacteroides sp.]
MSESINHSGIVQRITENSVYVRIVQQSACSGCHAKSMCSASETKEKIIEIPDTSGEYKVDEPVEIIGRATMGLQAVLLAFVVPLVGVVAAIVVGSLLAWKETFSGLIGLILLVVYYCLLYLFREQLKKRFVFTLQKLN